MTYTFSTELFSDLFKDVNGFRPRGHWFYDESTTDDERQAEWDYLCDRLKMQNIEEEATKAANLEALRVQVQQNMTYGAKDEQEALRWVVLSLNPTYQDLCYGGEWVCYELGLSFNDAYIFNKACAALRVEMEKEIA